MPSSSGDCEDASNIKVYERLLPIPNVAGAQLTEATSTPADRIMCAACDPKIVLPSGSDFDNICAQLSQHRRQILNLARRAGRQRVDSSQSPVAIVSPTMNAVFLSAVCTFHLDKRDAMRFPSCYGDGLLGRGV